MTTSNKKKALKVMINKSEIGKSKSTSTPGAIRSIGTQRTYADCLKVYLDWLIIDEIPSDNASKMSNVQLFLDERSGDYVQSTLNKYRMALQKYCNKDLPFVQSVKDWQKAARAYSDDAFKLLIKDAPVQVKLALKICFYAGLRAKEIASLERDGEAFPTRTREWSHQLFEGMSNYVVYLVTGKGGLKRRVAIPEFLVGELEEARVSDPVKKVDRGVFYYPKYNLLFGQALSNKFSRLSKKVLGLSTGLHGLRHSYAQRRIFVELAHLNPLEAMLIVSQEMGHFRPEIIKTYLLR